MRVYLETNARVSMGETERRIVMVTKVIYLIGMVVLIHGSALMSDGTWAPIWLFFQAVVEGTVNAYHIPDHGRVVGAVWCERAVCVLRYLGKMIAGFMVWSLVAIYQM